MYTTSLAEGDLIPPQVAVGGRLAEILYYGAAPTYPLYNQVNFRVPAGVAQGTADGTHVDYDRGLNAAVTRLRQALADSAERPRYVETVAQRGYRFIAPIEGVVERDAARAAPETTPHRGRTRRHLVWIVAGCVAMATVPIIFLLSRRESTPPALEIDDERLPFRSRETNFHFPAPSATSRAPVPSSRLP